MPAFLLGTDARARRASKELRSLLSALSVDLTLRQSQNALARMLGHPDWNGLIAAVGTGVSPDDADLDAAALAERHGQQEAVLRSLGLSYAQARAVRERLSPTGRDEASVAEREVVPLQDTYVYHPLRILDAFIAAFRFRHAYAAHNRLGKPSDTVEALVGDMKAWVGDSYALTPLDAPLMNVEVAGALNDYATRILEGEGPLLDVSSVAGELALRDVSGETYRGAWDDLGRAYVHLGTNAFPSPFPGCGVEGCYVHLAAPSQDGPGRVELVFVASPETVPGTDIHESPTFREYDDAIFNLRHVLVGAETAEGGDPSVRLGDILDGAPYDEMDETYHDAWRPYLAAPLNAVWNGLRAFRESTLDVREGLLVDAGDHLFRKLRKARTERQMRAASAQVAEETGEVVVRFVGGTNPMATDVGCRVPRRPDDEVVAVEEPEHWARAYIRMASEASGPAAAIAMSDRAQAMLRLDAAGEYGAAYRSDRLWAWALAHKAEALCDTGDFGKAAEVGAEILGRNEEDYLSFRFRLVAIHVAADDHGRARRLLAGLGRKPEPRGLMAWTKALVEAASGTPQAGRDALADALRAAPEVADRLLDPSSRDRELWMDSDIVLAKGEGYAIAGIQRDAWDRLPGGRESIAAAVARHRDETGAVRHANLGGRRFSYAFLPYTNEEFEDAAAGFRMAGYVSMPCEKAPGGRMAMRPGAPEDVMTLLDMDPCAAAIDPMPCRVMVEHGGRSVHLVPDARVTTVAGDEWFLLVAQPSGMLSLAVAAFANEGRHLMVVDPSLASSPLVRGTGYPQSKARGETVGPALGRAIAQAVADLPAHSSIKDVVRHLEADPAVTKDPEVKGHLDQLPGRFRAELFAAMMVSKIFRAVRDGYVDHDPLDRDKGILAALHPRHARLDSHSAIAALTPYLVAGDAKSLAAISGRALDAARSAPMPPSAADGWDAALAEWSPYAKRTGNEPVDIPRQADFPSELERDRAIDGVPGLLVATFDGTTGAGEPWKASVRRRRPGEHDVRVEIGDAQAPRWGVYRASGFSGRKSWSINIGYPMLVVGEGAVSLEVRDRREVYWDDGEPRGDKLRSGDHDVVSTVAGMLLARFEGDYAASILVEARHRVAASMVSGVREAERVLAERRDKAASLAAELGGLVSALPDKVRRRLAGKSPEELSQAKEYPFDTVLGVLLLSPMPDGESVGIRVTGRRSALARVGVLAQAGRGAIEVGKDGTVTGAAFSGCPRASGEAHLRTAVSRFVRETPGAFERAAVADCAKDLVKAMEHVAKAEARLDECMEALDEKVGTMTALRERLSGIPGTEAVAFPARDPSYPRVEHEADAEMAPLW